MESALKFIVLAIIVFLCFNRIQLLRHDGQFDDIGALQSKAAVMDKLGAPFDEYTCKSGTAPMVQQVDSLCKEQVVVVDSYYPCLIPPVCPGWYSVAFDKSDKVIYKYHFSQ